MKRNVLTAFFLLFLAIAGTTSFLLTQEFGSKLSLESGKIVRPARELPKFSLSSEAGTFSNEDLLNKWTILAFGFTNCPDICPATMAFYRDELKLLDDESELVQFVMISVDPQRDTPEKLAAYAKSFDSRIITLTGENEELKKIAKSLGAGFAKEVIPGDDSGQYSMAHSPYVYLINPEGQWQGLYNPPIGRGKLAMDVSRLIQAF